jgi:hypothetical protein
MGVRNKDTLLGADQAYAKATNSPMVNLAIGGQNAYQSDLRYFHANTDYVRRNLWVKVLQAPRGFQYLDDPAQYYRTLKGIVEMHAQSWDGFNRTLTVNSVEAPVGGAGEMQQTPSNVTRQRSDPTMTIREKYGRPAQRFLESWITELIMDPDAKVPGIATRANAPTDLLPDMYSMSIIAFEPDPTFTKVNAAWLMTNMYPTTAGDFTGRRDKTSDGEELVLSIPWTGIQQVGIAVDRLAQALLDAMPKTGTSPNLKPAFMSGVENDVASHNVGLTEQISEFNRTFIRL